MTESNTTGAPVVLFEKTGAVGRLTLNRPQKLNSFTGELALALQEALDRCADDDEIRAVYLTGAGKGFCAGQDLKEITGPDSPTFQTILGKHLHPVVARIRALEKPVLCGVNGIAAGAGANLALACDITIAAESAAFLQAFSKIGLLPDTGGTFFLPRLVGFQRAGALMMLAESISARQAADMGMIYQAVPDHLFESEASMLAERLAQMPTRALALTKQALNQSFYNTFTQQLELEERLQAEAGATHDYQEGVQAFLEKRPARFQGR